MIRSLIRAALIACGFLHAVPALAAGEILITQAKALAGNITPGDTAGFPVSLTLPGSYVLASNLTVPAGKNGIGVPSSFVTIDLNGFRMHGGGVAGHGIDGSPDALGATVRNGTITGFTLNGINARGAFWEVEDMRLLRNGRHGITCSASCQIESSIVAENRSDGIIISSGLIIGNVIERNSGYGLFTGGGFVGYGNNTFSGNNGGEIPANQSGNAFALNPNACSNAACPVN
jgi:hypothetical protein